MFSYFQKGIKDTTPFKIIDFPTLVSIIKNNPHQSQIETIRELKSCGDIYYKRLKETLPNITPNCIVKERSLKDDNLNKNFISSSGYIYLDIDNVEDVQKYKRELITKYKSQAAMICISSGGDGVSMLFKLSNSVTKDNFEELRAGLINTLMIGEKIDPNAGGLGRAMFISSDPDVFVNYENTVTIETGHCSIKKTGNNPNSYSSYNRPISRFSDNNDGITKSFSRYTIHHIVDVLSNITTHTIVNNENPIVDFKEVDYVEVYIPKVIPDSTKHTTYFKIIHQLYYLNPGVNLDYLFSFLFYINNNHAKPKMEMKELVRFFNAVIDQIKTTGDVKYSAVIKRVHFNPAAELSKEEKQIIAAQLNGAYKRSVTINKISAAKMELEIQGRKITKRAVAELVQLDEKTVRKHFNAAAVDMTHEVGLWN